MRCGAKSAIFNALTALFLSPPGWLQDWGKQIGAKLEDGLRENPSWIAFARENGTVYHTYTVSAPDPFVAPYYSFLQERTPKGADDSEPRSWRKDEYPTSPSSVVIQDDR